MVETTPSSFAVREERFVVVVAKRECRAAVKEASIGLKR